MKKIFFPLAVLMLCLSTTLQAKTLKIGVIDFGRIMQESPQAEKARKSIEDEFAPRQKELRDLGDRISKKEDQYNRDSAIMSDAERDKMEHELVTDKRDFKRKQDQFRDDVSFKQNELIGSLQRKLVSNIQLFGKSKGYDLLLADGVIYASKALNITDEVLAYLQKKNK